MEGGPSAFPQGFPCLVVLRIPLAAHLTSPTGLSPSPAGFSKTVPLSYGSLIAVLTPECSHPGLGSFPFARRYLENRCFFLFLRLLRCFSSPGYPPHAMDSRRDDRCLSCRVSPFRHPRINGYVLLPAAFRSLSRLSSALSAKASALRPFCLTFCRSFCLCSVINRTFSDLLEMFYFFSICRSILSLFETRRSRLVLNKFLNMQFSRYIFPSFFYEAVLHKRTGSHLLSRAVTSKVPSAV